MRFVLIVSAFGVLCSGSMCGVVDDRGHYPVEVDVGGAMIYGGIGDSFNTVITVPKQMAIQEYVYVSAIGWDVGLQTFGGAWLSDATVRVSNNGGDFFDVAIGGTDDFSGAGSYSSGGLVNIHEQGVGFFIGDDDSVHLEFFSSWDEQTGIFGGLDHILASGSLITIGTRLEPPAPASVFLLGMASTFAFQRRRAARLV
jgi:hypothetical protein